MLNGIGRKFLLANVLVAMFALFGLVTVSGVAAQSTTTLTVTTSSDPAGLTGFFYYGDAGQFFLDDGGSRTTDVVSGTISVYQSVPQGFALNIDCGSAPATLIDNGKGVAVDVADGENVTCNFDNQDVGGTITVVNASSSGNSYFYYGDIDQFNLSDGETYSVTSRFPGDYTIFQSVPTGEALDVSCTGGDFTPASESVTVTLPDNGDVVCTFTNSDVGGSISITNVSDAGTFDYYGSTGQFALANGETNTASNLLAGEYIIAQSIPAGIVLDISCDSPNAVVNSNGEGVTVNLATNEDVSCTFSNTDVGGSITVVAAGDAADDLFNYYGTFGIVTGTLGTVFTRDNLYPGDYDLYQSIPAGFELDITCVGADTTPINAQGLTVNLDANEDVTCTFDNTDVGGSITVVAAGDAADDLFNYYGSFGIVTGTLGTIYTRDNLYPGDYDLYQSIPAGFEVAISCVGGDSTPIDGQPGVTVNLDANEDVVCTFTNTDVAASVTLVVETIPAGLTGLQYYGSFGIFSMDDGDRETYGDLYPGEYQLFQNIPVDYTLSIDCGDASAEPSEDGKGVTLTLAANEDVTCTYTTAIIIEDLLVNGDFEQGQFVGWEEYSSKGFDLVVDNDRYQSDPDALNGEWKAWLGGARYEQSYLWQEVTIPEGQTSVLEFNYRIVSSDWCGYDWASVYVHDGDYYYRIASAALCARNSTGNWIPGRVNLSYFQGQTVNVLFYAYNDGYYSSSIYLDDVVLAVSNVEPQDVTLNVPSIVGDLSDATVVEQDVQTMASQTTPETRDDSTPDADDRNSAPTAVAMGHSSAEHVHAVLLPALMLPLLVGLTGFALLKQREG